ncbi:uncharacterized protein LOC141809915 [Halichoeres trimaculatus]|uniref:uncharacterized protein LOC141809915 n=1 Tax=Halichoeres trimaculatus TaxID=147232 RepID=UPI003D9E9CE7
MQPLRTLGPLMLLILLCDADSPCSTELNPLTLDPPVVIGEQGESVEVNCSSTLEDHYGMYWKVGNTESDREDDRSFIPELLTLSDWNTTAECRIKLNEVVECGKELEIIMYKMPALSMYATKYFPELVEGMSYELQCDIEAAPIQNVTVKWYKDKEIISTDTFTNTAKIPEHESSILMVNLSKEDNGAQFRCEAQLDFGIHGVKTPVSSLVHHVSVMYAPRFNVTTGETYYFLKKGVNTTLNCEAEGNPPPVFNWTRDGVSLLEKTNHLNITRVDDDAIYNCTAYNHLGSITKSMNVQVIKTAKSAAPAAMTTAQASAATAPEAPTPTYNESTTAPETPTPTYNESTTAPGTPMPINNELTTTAPETPKPTYNETTTTGGCPLVLTPPEIVVKYGDPASINCSTSASDADIMGWEATVGGTLSQPPTVTWRVEELQMWDIQPKCFLTRLNNEQCTMMPKVTLYKTPDIVSVSAVDPGPFLEGKDFVLTCDVIHVAPKQNLKLKWYRGGEIVSVKTFTSTTVTPVNVSFPLKVTSRRGYNGAAFKCMAELHFGLEGPIPAPTAISSPFIADVHYPPVFEEKSYILQVNTGENVTLHCSAGGNPPPKIHWEYVSAVNVKETTGGRHVNITITGATSTNVGVYKCNATNDIGSVTRSVTVVLSHKISTGPSWFIWVLLILCVVLFLAVLMIILHNRRKKNGQYSFVSSNATDNIPMSDKPEA